jgi:hypothetical protein
MNFNKSFTGRSPWDNNTLFSKVWNRVFNTTTGYMPYRGLQALMDKT